MSFANHRLHSLEDTRFSFSVYVRQIKEGIQCLLQDKNFDKQWVALEKHRCQKQLTFILPILRVKTRLKR